MGDYIKKSDKENLRLLNWDLSNLYYYLDILNKSQSHYNTKKWLYNWSYSFKVKQLDEIKEKIPEVYQHINEVKASIADIKARMNKNKLNNSEEYYDSYNESHNRLYYDEYYNENENEDEYYDENTNNEYKYNNSKDDEDDYRYNPITGTFE